MKLTDKAILRMVSESPGRNTSEPIGGPNKKIDPRGRVFSCRMPWCTTPIEAESSLGPDSHHPIISLSGIPSCAKTRPF